MGESVRTLAAGYRDTYEVPKGFGAVLVRERELRPPYDPHAELVPEILRLKQHGVLIWGAHKKELVPEPSAEDFRAYARVFYPWLRAAFIDCRPEEARTVDATVNTILYELRLMIWDVTSQYVSDKPRVIPAFFSQSQDDRLRRLLLPIRDYVAGRTESLDLDLLESTLTDVSALARRTVAWCAEE